ncbi:MULTISPECIES: IclR family transcriptional regulator [Alphaproteobacteria]|uniref:IclR family transcriptional regulator n=1 Tax=Alphaproteobacteria TaxID=28211 RepID=UPI0012BD054C|nr:MULTISPECIES: IclR family transcriptional regulator [Alphaproteobacteria]MTH98991.1 IclR family transcriptional regulator [Roseibium sp. RKSG952]
MGTTTKSLKLLDHFSAAQPEIGLSSLARLSKRDKASVYRSLNELAELGFVEQNRHTKRYRLGPTVIRLANVREATVPIKDAVAEPLAQLVSAVRETAHVTLLNGTGLIVAEFCQSRHHGTRVEIETADILPLHATASGCAIMAFADPGLIDRVLSAPLQSITQNTVTDPALIRSKVDDARRIGFGLSDGEYESDVCSMAAPIFDPNNDCIGAVSVACPKSRLDTELKFQIRENLKPAARAISSACGGQVPPTLEEIWKLNDPT